jgi:hypothetical protein
MVLTKHAATRQQERGIPPMIIELLIEYGACEKAGDGTYKHFFDGRSKTAAGSSFGSVVPSDWGVPQL